MNTKQIITCILLVTTLYIVPNEHLSEQSSWQKKLNYISESSPMYWFEKNIQAWYIDQLCTFFNLSFGNMPSSSIYQELGDEAQSAVGIPTEYRVPIKKIPCNNIFATLVISCTLPNAIYINEERLDHRPYGVKRCILYQEAIHKKYNDPSSSALAEWLSLLSSGYIIHKIVQYSKPHITPDIIHGLIIGISSLVIAKKTTTQYQHFAQRRADIEGSYATQCSQCVEENVHYRYILFEEEPLLKESGYLNPDELALIVQDLAQNNKTCTYHNAIIQQDLTYELSNIS